MRYNKRNVRFAKNDVNDLSEAALARVASQATLLSGANPWVRRWAI